MGTGERHAVPGADDLRGELRRLLADQDHEVVDVAARLIGEARGEAHARVRSLLTDAYTDVLLDHVRDALGPDQEPATRDLGWYVYCVVGGDHGSLPDDLEGVDPHHPVHALEQDGLAAVVSRVPLAEFGEEPLREHLSDMEWLERTARRHEHVQEQVAAGGTPIPMRLCSIYRDESGVRSMLVREGPALREALDNLRGKTEWGVKAFADVDAVEPAPPRAESASGSGEGAAYMQGRLQQRRRREETAARVDEACDSLHAALCAVAADGVLLSPHRPEMTGRDVPMIFNASYLVVGADADAFRAEFDRLSRELSPLGIELEQTGPWPPYNFVPGAIGAGW
jgi:Gas vesicle synthesis protein GvpL/GvpF